MQAFLCAVETLGTVVGGLLKWGKMGAFFTRTWWL